MNNQIEIIYDNIRSKCLEYYGNPPENNLEINYLFRELPKSETDDSLYLLDEILVNHINSSKKLIMTMLLQDTFGISLNDKDFIFLDEPDDSLYKDYSVRTIKNYTKKNIIYENQVVSNLSDSEHKKVNESIFQAIGKLPFFIGGKGWSNHVIAMALWYNENVETYQSRDSASDTHGNGTRKAYKCPLIGGKNIFDDCSSFVFACLQYYGIIHKGNFVPSSRDFCGEEYNKQFSDELKQLGFYNIPYDESILKPFDILALCDSNGHHVEIFGGVDSEGNKFSYGWGNNNSKKKGKKLPHKFVDKKYTSIWRTNDVYGGLIGKLIFNEDENNTEGNMIVTAQKISSAQTKANAKVVVNMLMSDMNLTKEQACGVAGVMVAESGVNPGIVNAGEKKGTYKSSGANNEGTPYGTKHCPWSYGAGICQWTFTQRKESAIMGGLGVSKQEAINIIKTKGIEGLSLQQQVKMLEYEFNNSYKYTLAGIKKCNTASDSAATFYCHAITGYSTSTSPASKEEINKHNARYAKVGAKSQINKGMGFAEGLLKEI